MHCLSAYIAKKDKIKIDLVEVPTADLPQEFILIPCTSHLYKALGKANKIPLREHEDIFSEYDEDKIDPLDIADEIAYIDTDYFGGFGEQYSILYIQGKLPVKLRTINESLSSLGVINDAGEDEFYSLNLTSYRSTNDFERSIVSTDEITTDEYIESIKNKYNISKEDMEMLDVLFHRKNKELL